MPLKRGSSQRVISANIAELHHGATYARTKKQFGVAKANAQAEAIAYKEARKSRAKPKPKRRTKPVRGKR